MDLEETLQQYGLNKGIRTAVIDKIVEYHQNIFDNHDNLYSKDSFFKGIDRGFGDYLVKIELPKIIEFLGEYKNKEGLLTDFIELNKDLTIQLGKTEKNYFMLFKDGYNKDESLLLNIGGRPFDYLIWQFGQWRSHYAENTISILKKHGIKEEIEKNHEDFTEALLKGLNRDTPDGFIRMIFPDQDDYNLKLSYENMKKIKISQYSGPLIADRVWRHFLELNLTLLINKEGIGLNIFMQAVFLDIGGASLFSTINEFELSSFIQEYAEGEFTREEAAAINVISTYHQTIRPELEKYIPINQIKEVDKEMNELKKGIENKEIDEMEITGKMREILFKKRKGEHK